MRPPARVLLPPLPLTTTFAGSSHTNNERAGFDFTSLIKSGDNNKLYDWDKRDED